MIGDIAGSKYEFNNTFDYDFEIFGEGCDFTDDTICTVAVADAILYLPSKALTLLSLQRVPWSLEIDQPSGGRTSPSKLSV